MPDRFITPEPLPVEYDQELLTILMEECMEVAIRASKMKRFGVLEIQPGQADSNKRRLGFELGDVSFMVDLCMQRGLVSARDIEIGRGHKRAQLAKFLQTQPESKGVEDNDT